MEYNGFPKAFPKPFDDSSDFPEPCTLVVRLSAAIRSKPGWWLKFKNPEIRGKWKAEALDQTMTWIGAATMLVPFEERDQFLKGEDRYTVDVELEGRQICYALDELEGYERLRDDATGIEVSCLDGIWQSDQPIPHALRGSLNDEVRILEDVPEEDKDRTRILDLECNIDELAFRIAVDEPEPAKFIEAARYDCYAHQCTWGMFAHWHQPTKLNNAVGAVETIEGRCLAFPNTYQHRVSPFRLIDSEKPGYRKILALFLVDPSIKPIPSTTHITPQHASWAMRALADPDTQAPVHRLPKELLDKIADESALMNDREAKEIRLELMKKRTAIMEEAEDSLFSRFFNLCEH